MCRTSQPHFTETWLVGYKIYKVSRIAQFIIWNLASDRLHLVAFKLRLSVEIQIGMTFDKMGPKRKMGPKKGRRAVRKIGVPTETPTEVELGDTAADIQRRRENRDRRRRRHRNHRGREGKGGSHDGENYTFNRAGSDQKASKHLQQDQGTP